MQQAQEVTGTRPVIVPEGTTFRAAHLGHQCQQHCALALYSNSSGPKQAIDTQILVGRTDSAAAAAAKSLQLCLTLCDPIDGSPPGSRPWDSPGKNTGVGCHFLLQCRNVKSESEVVQCPTLRNSMDYSPPGSSVHGIFQARVLEWGTIAYS